MIKEILKKILTPNRRKTLRAIIYYIKSPYRYLHTWYYQVKTVFLSYSKSEELDNSNKKVSIIVPTLSKGPQADHLFKLRKLLSVYLPNQNHKNYEVIVWCDGPNANVEEMIVSLKDERIRVYSTDNTIGKWGHPQTRMGIEKATGDFFVRMNDDNIPYRNYLSSLIGGFNNGAGIVYGRVIYKGDARTAHKEALANSFVIPGDKRGELRHMNIDCMCCMVQMDLAKKYVQCFNDRYAADWFFIKDMLKDNIKARFIDRIIGEKF